MATLALAAEAPPVVPRVMRMREGRRRSWNLGLLPASTRLKWALALATGWAWDVTLAADRLAELRFRDCHVKTFVEGVGLVLYGII